MKQALEHLRLDQLFVVYPGERTYSLADRVSAVPLAESVARARAP